jgi:histidinol-phosphate/aromatic aminotransferase/cobyric acid decarboxylase-like protein
MASLERLPLPRAVEELTGVQSYVEKKKEQREYITGKDVSEGMSPFGPPPQYGEILDELYSSGLLYESGTKYAGNLKLEPATQNIRERHELPSGYDILIGFAGSNELLERVVMTLKSNTYVFGIGPHFTGFHKSLKVIGKSKYGPISPPLEEPLEDILKNNKYNPVRYPKKPDALYLAVPDARGDNVEPELLWDFVDNWCDNNVLIILDRALADFSPDSNHTHPNLVEVRSFSKAMGLPGDGFSYILGSNSYIEVFKKHMKDYSYRGKAQFMAELLNRISAPKIVYPQLEMVRRRTTEVKSKMISALKKYDIQTLPTDVSTPLQFVDGEVESFFDTVDLPTTPGSGFFYTYDTLAKTQMTNRFARIGLPILDYDDPELNLDDEIDLIAKRIKGAIHIAKEYQSYRRTIL